MPSGSVNPFKEALFDAFSLAAIVRMETLKIFKDPTEMLSRSLQPVLWLLIYGSAMNRTGFIPTGDLSYLAFLAPGIVAQSITFVSIFNGLSIIWERDMGILQRMMTTPVRRSVLVLGKMLAGSVRSFSQLIVVLALATFMGIELIWSPGRVVGLVILTILGSTFFSGLSMTIASIVRTRERMMGIGQLVTMPLFFASNALYPVSIMPAWLQALSRLNPLTYLVDGLRNLLLYRQPVGIATDLAILVFSTLLVWSVCSVLYPRLLR